MPLHSANHNAKLVELYHNLLERHATISAAMQERDAASSLEEKRNKQKKLTRAERDLRNLETKTYLVYCEVFKSKTTISLRTWKEMATPEFIEAQLLVLENMSSECEAEKNSKLVQQQVKPKPKSRRPREDIFAKLKISLEKLKTDLSQMQSQF